MKSRVRWRAWSWPGPRTAPHFLSDCSGDPGGRANLTWVSEFLLRRPQATAAAAYTVPEPVPFTGLGNLLIVLAIATDAGSPRPGTSSWPTWPLWTCFTSIIIPNMLANHVSGHKGIPSSGCLTQMSFIWFAGIDSFPQAAMAYSPYAAICPPLHYATSVPPRLCGSWRWHPGPQPLGMS